MVLEIWPGEYTIMEKNDDNYESKILHLNTDKSNFNLNWFPILNFKETIEIAVKWYLKRSKKINPLDLCKYDINNFEIRISKQHD